ncbi:MAG: aminotransferase class V-fold PLP-dependent enzyme [Fibrobacterota bacterium]
MKKKSMSKYDSTPRLHRKEIFLNHAAVSPVPRRVARRLSDAAAELSRKRPDLKGWVNIMEECRKKTAARINCSPESIGFTQNTSHAVSLVAEGLNLKKGDEILVSPVEYPANYYPWKHLSRRGIKITELPADEPTPSPGTIEEYCTRKTRLVALSHVQYLAGHTTDLAGIAEICKKKNIYTFADLIQSVGVLPVDVSRLGIDFAAFGSQKWLLAPPGIGVLYIAKHLLNEITPVITGAFSVRNPLAPQEKHLEFQYTAKKFESGTMNFILFYALAEALDIIEEKTTDYIYTTAMEKRNYLCNLLIEKGYTIHSPGVKSALSPILTFSAATEEGTKTLYRTLAKGGVTATFRSNTIRFSPHYYTPVKKLKKLKTLL